MSDARTTTELQDGLGDVLAAPKTSGRLELIVRRPGVGEREVLDEGSLTREDGLAGDGWRHRGGHRDPDPDVQLTVMNARLANLVAGDRDRWPLAGDQLYVDFDLSVENLPAGTRVSIGDAVIEFTEPPHTGCKKFVQRFGMDAMLFVNAPEGRANRLRGANARVVTPGVIRVGDAVAKLDA